MSLYKLWSYMVSEDSFIRPELAWTEVLLLLLFAEIVNDNVTIRKMDFEHSVSLY